MDLKPTSAKMLRTVAPLRIAGVLVDLFTRVGQRSPPSENKKKHIRLISIAVSNYVEKVRWGLDMLEANAKSPIYYTEDLHPPAFAAFQSVPASKDQASASPMVILPTSDNGGTRAVWGSDTILRELCSDPETVNLYPKDIAETVKELEDELASRLGASARCFGYNYLLHPSKQYYKAASKFLTLNCPKIEQIAFDKMLDKGLAKGMVRLMKVEEYGPIAEEEIRKVFDELSLKLEKGGGEYLMDTPSRTYGFTAADLNLCALSYFLIRPPEMAPFLLPESENPPELLQLGEDLRATTAGKHVLHMYKKHRPVNAESGQIELKKIDQNRIPWPEIAGSTALVGAIFYGLK